MNQMEYPKVAAYLLGMYMIRDCSGEPACSLLVTPETLWGREV